MTSPWGEKAIEQVARALCARICAHLPDEKARASFVERQWRAHIEAAKTSSHALIAALRRPSDEMIAMAYDEGLRGGNERDAIEALLTRADEEIG